TSAAMRRLATASAGKAWENVACLPCQMPRHSRQIPPGNFLFALPCRAGQDLQVDQAPASRTPPATSAQVNASASARRSSEGISDGRFGAFGTPQTDAAARGLRHAGAPPTLAAPNDRKAPS